MRRGWRPVSQALLLDPGLKQRRVSRLADNNLCVGPFPSQDAADPLQRAARAVASHPEIEPVAREVVDDFARGGAGMEIRVGFVLELPRHEPAIGLSQIDCLLDHSDRALGGRRYDDFGAQKAHQSPPFDAEALGHCEHERIPFSGADHRKSDAGVAARRLDDRLSGLGLAGLLRRLDDAKRQAVLDRAQRVERLDFYIEVDANRGEAVDPDNRRMSNGFQNALKSRHPNPPVVSCGAPRPWIKWTPFLNLSRSNAFPKEPYDHEVA